MSISIYMSRKWFGGGKIFRFGVNSNNVRSSDSVNQVRSLVITEFLSRNKDKSNSVKEY